MDFKPFLQIPTAYLGYQGYKANVQVDHIDKIRYGSAEVE